MPAAARRARDRIAAGPPGRPAAARPAAGRAGPHARLPGGRAVRPPGLDLRAEVRRPPRPRPVRRRGTDPPQPQRQGAEPAVPRGGRGPPDAPRPAGRPRRRGRLLRRPRADQLPRPRSSGSTCSTPARSARGPRRYPAYIYLFDVLYFDGYDVTGLPLWRAEGACCARRSRWSDRVGATPFRARATGSRPCGRPAAAGEEGIVGKRLDSPYVAGRERRLGEGQVRRPAGVRRSAGFTDPQRSRVGLGALLVGLLRRRRPAHLRRQGRHRLHPRESCSTSADGSTGWIETSSARSTTATRRAARHVHWVRPEARGRDRVRRVDAERPAPPAAVRGAPARQAGPRDAAASGRPLRPSTRADDEGVTPMPETTAMPLAEYRAKRDFRKTRRAGARDRRPEAQAADLRRPGAPRHATSTTTSGWRPTACSRAGRSPRSRRWTRRSSGWPSRSRTTRSRYATFEGTIPQGPVRRRARSRSGTAARTRA